MIFRQNLTMVESVESLKPVGPVMDGPSVPTQGGKKKVHDVAFNGKHLLSQLLN